MTNLPKIPLDQRHEWALRLILIESDRVPGDFLCETFTSGIGACHKDGRRPDAEYTSERWCHSCLAYFALHGSFPTTIASGAAR